VRAFLSCVALILCGAGALSAQTSEWKYGGFADLGYLLDLNHPANKVFRSRGTTWHTDALHLNMAAAYLKKQPSVDSRWGVELTAQAGKDAELFGLSATPPRTDKRILSGTRRKGTHRARWNLQQLDRVRFALRQGQF